MLATVVVVALASGTLVASASPPVIIDRPIRFDRERIELTRAYIQKHYGLKVDTIKIVPKAIVIHWTVTPTLRAAWRGFNRVRMRSSRRYLLRGGLVNVSAHFLVDRDGTIYRIMPEDWMARHCIGLNYDSIGVENIGGGGRTPLTRKQLAANAALLRYLVRRHPSIKYVLGHMEWKRFEAAPFFRELDPTYRNAKADPGRRFMRDLRRAVADMRLMDRYTPARSQPVGSQH
jgi:N-acetyl-anhydromuramyl-L-alanine amidase AmpD